MSTTYTGYPHSLAAAPTIRRFWMGMPQYRTGSKHECDTSRTVGQSMLYCRLVWLIRARRAVLTTGTMSEREVSNPAGPWTVSHLAEVVAHTDEYAGGGAVAAMTLAGAAATAELVFQLTARRRDLSDDEKQSLQMKVEHCRQLRARFLTAIDEDMASLTELMDAQRQARRARKSTQEQDLDVATARVRAAVDQAIKTPLLAAREASTLLDDIQDALPLARTFTVSDLGAAAATTNGAITALLLMAEVNLGMLDDARESDRLGEEINQLAESTSRQAESIVSTTRRVITANADRDGK